ncbi:GNAT family N-acetyltransferase [Actinoplanes sp. NPDC051851]|uniref:GNAT family N-acetyltransferase n=1 Tax=Actinoplanes sp. NPDC051851 TaxID=3154753 RepID=UPI00343B4450
MDQVEVLALLDRQLRREAERDGGTTRIERDDRVVRNVGTNAHDWNAVLWSDLDESTADAVIAEQVAYFRSLGLGFEWKHYSHDAPADLGDRLTAAGLVADEPETVMVAAVADLPTEVILPDGVRLEPVTDEHGVDLLIRAAEEAFGESRSWLRERLIDQLADAPDRTRIVVAMAGDRPVCGARIDFVPGTAFAGLWGGGTVHEWRGRGVYRATVAYRTRIAAELGYEYLQVDASDESRPILARLGFTALTTTTPYELPPPPR